MTAFLNFQRQLNLWLEHIAPHVSDLQKKTILFISYGPKDQRCNVWHSEKTSFSQAKIQLLAFINDQFAHESLVDYIKIDVAYNLTKQAWKVVEQQVHHQFHNNHYRKGIGFDEQCSVAFLEQEIYGKAIIRGLSYDKPNFFDETNLNYAIKQKYNATKPQIKLQELQDIWTFDTYAAFYENGQFINLASGYDANGIRAISSNKKQHFQSLIEKIRHFCMIKFKKMANLSMAIFLPMIEIFVTTIRYATVPRCMRCWKHLKCRANQNIGPRYMLLSNIH